MSRQKSPQVGETRTFHGILVNLGRRVHFPHVITTTIKTVPYRIYHNAQHALSTFNDKPRWRKEKELIHATSQTLPDDVLLEIFDYHRQASLRSGPWKWHRLAQVCRKWRFVVFAYPRRLDLRIIATYNRSVEGIPDFWPILPIIIWYPQSSLHPFLSPKDEDNICDILKNPARICELHIDITHSLLGKCASSLLEPFPALEHLRLKPHSTMETIVLPANFLGNSAPALHVIHLDSHCTAFPTLPRLLSFSKNIVSLRLEKIQGDGFKGFSKPEDLAIGLSTASQLKYLNIDFDHDMLVPYPPSPALHTRFVLPALIEFQYAGDCVYLEDFASRIDAPIIEQIGVTFSSSSENDTYELCELFGRGEELRSSRDRSTRIRFFEESVVFVHHFSRSPSSRGSFRLRMVGPSWLDELVSIMTYVCSRFESSGAIQKVTRLEIDASGFPEPSRWYREIDPANWLTLLQALTGVKRLHVVGTLVPSVVSALAQVTGETAREILPALQDLHLQGGPGTSGWASASVEPFITARKLYGLPVSVHYKGLESGMAIDRSIEN